MYGHAHVQRMKTFVTWHSCSQGRWNKVTLCLLISALPVSRCSSCGIYCHVLTFLCFFGGILPFKRAPMCDTEVLFRLPTGEQAAMCYTKKIHAVTNIIQAHIAVLLDVSSMLMSQQ